MTAATPSRDDQVTVVTCRYWGGARAAAGVETETVEAETVADVLERIVERRPGDRRFADVVEVCAVMVGEVPLGGRDPGSVQVRSGDVVELLPPFAGG